MPQNCRWTDDELYIAVKKSRSYRQVIFELKLIPAGGNYNHIMRRVRELRLDTTHFRGKGWNKGWTFDPRKPKTPISKWLVKGSTVQSNTLKRRLLQESIKLPVCELCGWSEKSADGRIPIELDHVNGQKTDNRVENLRILCPNCHSLQPTHRGKIKK